MKKRTFTAEFKTKVVLKLLTGEKELNILATENEIAPNQLRNWKSEFLANASAAFDDKRGDALKADLEQKEAENDRLYKKVGQLTTENDWLKKNCEQISRLKKE